MDPKIIAKHGIKSAIITAAIPWVEDLLAQVENPDRRVLDGLEQLRRQIQRPPSIERLEWRPPLRDLYALSDENGPCRQAALVLLSLIRAECNRDCHELLDLALAWRAYTGQPGPEEG